MSDSIALPCRANIGLRSLLVVLLVVMVFVLSSKPASAGSGPLAVTGKVCEGDTTHPVEDADVLVEVLDAGNSVLDSQSYTTDADGIYFAFWMDAPSGSAKVRVTATHPVGAEKTESVDIPPTRDIDLNIIFPYGIPQIVGMVGMFVAVSALGTVALVFLRKKRLQ